MEDKGKKAFDMIYEKIQEKDDFFVQDDKCVIRIEYKSKLISRDSTNVARTRKKYQFITFVIKILIMFFKIKLDTELVVIIPCPFCVITFW